MTFTAKLKRTSHIWRNWSGSGRTRGEISGVTFTRVLGTDYVTDRLTAEQVLAIRHNPAVMLEVMTLADAESPMLVDIAEDDAKEFTEEPRHANRFSSGNQPRRGRR